jgi:hypothetical protein
MPFSTINRASAGTVRELKEEELYLVENRSFPDGSLSGQPFS